jgi:hypothetical protein
VEQLKLSAIAEPIIRELEKIPNADPSFRMHQVVSDFLDLVFFNATGNIRSKIETKNPYYGQGNGKVPLSDYLGGAHRILQVQLYNNPYHDILGYLYETEVQATRLFPSMEEMTIEAKKMSGGKVSDVMCGSGRLALAYARSVSSKVLFQNQDTDPKMIQITTLNMFFNGLESVNIVGNSDGEVFQVFRTKNKDGQMVIEEEKC